MADNINYEKFQKVEKWTTKENFKKLGNLTEIETGTEYNLTGGIDETDLDSNLLAKINGKLTAPTTPTAESAVTMLADGTVGTKLLSEIGGGGKLYRHYITFLWSSNNASASVDIILYSSSRTKLTNIEDFLMRKLVGIYEDTNTGNRGTVVVSISLPPQILIEGAVNTSSTNALGVRILLDEYELIDTVEEV